MKGHGKCQPFTFWWPVFLAHYLDLWICTCKYLPRCLLVSVLPNRWERCKGLRFSILHPRSRPLFPSFLRLAPLEPLLCKCASSWQLASAGLLHNGLCTCLICLLNQTTTLKLFLVPSTLLLMSLGSLAKLGKPLGYWAHCSHCQRPQRPFPGQNWVPALCVPNKDTMCRLHNYLKGNFIFILCRNEMEVVEKWKY